MKPSKLSLIIHLKQVRKISGCGRVGLIFFLPTAQQPFFLSSCECCDHFRRAVEGRKGDGVVMRRLMWRPPISCLGKRGGKRRGGKRREGKKRSVAYTTRHAHMFQGSVPNVVVVVLRRERERERNSSAGIMAPTRKNVTVLTPTARYRNYVKVSTGSTCEGTKHTRTTKIVDMNVDDKNKYKFENIIEKLKLRRK